MVLHIELPEDISSALQERWGDVPRHVLETLAVEGYRGGALTEYQVRRMLELESWEETNEFLRRAGANYQYSEEELNRDLETARKVAEKRDRELNHSGR